MRKKRDARGAILLQASFLILVLMGLAAVIIDMGIARATQGFMQVGADTASLEGLRLRDAVVGDSLQSDLQRRAAASRLTSLVYDEDLDLLTGPADYRLGAGPQIETGVGGVQDPAGGELVGQGQYIPSLQLNADANAIHGDLVSGTFTATDPLNPGNPNWHAERGTYARADFAAAAVADAPTAPAFLARLRRTNDRLGLDRQDGVSSAGPTLPFLFGLGSGVLSTPDSTVYDPRRDGITVRATSISEARRAVAVGIASDLVNGVVPVAVDFVDPNLRRILAFEDASWQADLATGGPFQMVVSSDGAIAGVPGGDSAQVRGLSQPVRSLARVGDPVLAAPAAGSIALIVAPASILGIRYVVLYSPGPGGAPRISGFGAVQINSAVLGTDSGGNRTLTLSGQKLASLVAPENASAVPALATDLSALLPTSVPRQPLLAPILAR